jgi:hypothetical protein
VRRDLALPGLPRTKVLALLVRLLDETLIRVGNESYARDNKSYGLTTLRSRHVRAERGRLRFAFRGKSGQEREVELSDKRLARIVRRVQQLPGQRLFQYVDDAGQQQPIDSGEVNDYLREACGKDVDAFSAKDFRTWGGTVQAAGVFARTPLPEKGGDAHSARACRCHQGSRGDSRQYAGGVPRLVHPPAGYGRLAGRQPAARHPRQRCSTSASTRAAHLALPAPSPA